MSMVFYDEIMHKTNQLSHEIYHLAVLQIFDTSYIAISDCVLRVYGENWVQFEKEAKKSGKSELSVTFAEISIKNY